ncbi:glycosyltransferase [Rhodoferax saidenbachensis]|uniref:Glycosyl transferase family 1 n=1 Tax=Rhodoferax saidenbachensis TaxID=1484693 RepID=A0A1P8KDX3_9BURK|nr:glycosyltransferase [Rhodoferax saidenbachensis]APW44172.1 hypothetical protein RS694_17655 [Rhodoferax saidenbachensis]
MRILIYWEQESWGGVDTHLLELLSTWPVPDDEIVLMVNKGNRGFARLRENFAKLPYVRSVEAVSYSHNELNRRCRESRLLRHVSKLLHFLQPLTYWLSVRRLQRQFSREGNFDLLLADNGGYPAAWGAICALEAGARAGIGARVMLVHHAAVAAAPFMAWFEQYVDRRMNRLASAFVCVSRATRHALLSRRWIDAASLRIRVIHNGIRSDLRQQEDAAVDIRESIGATKREKLIGIVGRVSPYKGHEDLVFALARVAPTVRELLRVIVIGSGDPADELERLTRIAGRLGVGDRIHFFGYVKGDPVSLIAQLDLLVVATRSFEGFGLTLIEAMGVGVPVLATDVGAIPEFVTPELGVLVSPGSPAELSYAFTSLVTVPEEWQHRASLARDQLLNLKQDMANEYRQLFLECLA